MSLVVRRSHLKRKPPRRVKCALRRSPLRVGHTRRWPAGRSQGVRRDAFAGRLSGCSPHVDYRNYQQARIPKPNRAGFPLDRRVPLRTLELRRHPYRLAERQGRCTRRNSSGLFDGDRRLGRCCRECNGRVGSCMPAGRHPQARALVQRQSRHESRRIMALTTEGAHRRRRSRRRRP